MANPVDVDALTTEFLERFQDPNEVLYLDTDGEDTYVWLNHTKWSTESAVEELFSARHDFEDLTELVDSLNAIAPDWVDRLEE